MLQINTGKFFKKSARQQTSTLKSVVYSNAKIYDFQTNAGNLNSLESVKFPHAYLYELTEKIEDTIELEHIETFSSIPYLKDFSLVASFGLRTIFSPDSQIVTRLVDKDFETQCHPKEILSRYFNEDLIIFKYENKEFKKFVKQLLRIERNNYLKAMRAIRCFVSAILHMQNNFSLAYTLLVASVDILSSNQSEKVNWSNIRNDKRNKFESVLKSLTPVKQNEIRDVILSFENPSTSRQYREFIVAQIYCKDYGTKLDKLIDTPPRIEMLKILTNSYKLRSKFIHNLSEIPEELTIPTDFEEFSEISTETYPTIQGLEKIARSAIYNFIMKCSADDKETGYDYIKELKDLSAANQGKPIPTSASAEIS